MKRVGLTLLVLSVFSITAYYVFTHPNIERAEQLQQQVEQLRQQNQKLADGNARLARKIEALRNDPRLAERRARANSRLARPGEVIFQFEKPQENIEIRVRLAVRPDSLTLAGKTLLIDRLAVQLDALHQEMPDAHLQVRFDKEVDALRRQRVHDLVAESALTPAEFIEVP